jgi:hypothetical protein
MAAMTAGSGQDAFATDELGNIRSQAERKVLCMASSGYTACADNSLTLHKVDALCSSLRLPTTQ